MNTARIRLPTHKPLKILPWYVNCTLDPKEATKVAAHVSGCPICQREVDDLAKLFSTRARLVPKRPVDEARLDDLFARIDRHEGERRKTQPVERISLRERLLGIMDWLIARPALAGACAALLLAVVAVPMLTSRTADDGAYEVLETPGAATEQLRVRLRFQTAPAQADVDRAVQTSLAQQKLANPYRIERQPNGEYVVIFEKKPGVAAMSRLLEDLRRTSNAADVAIDGG
jgi:anti-sigma factor RsiW